MATYKEMVALVENNPIADFFWTYSGLTRTASKPKVDIEFIQKRLVDYEPDLMMASTHRYGCCAKGNPKEVVKTFRRKSLEWAIEHFRIRCGQWYFGAAHLLTKDILMSEILQEEVKSLNDVYDIIKDIKDYRSLYYHLKNGEITRTSRGWRM